MSDLRHFAELTSDEIWELKEDLIATAVRFVKRNRISGLSEAQSHNVYGGIQNMIDKEIASAKVRRKTYMKLIREENE